MHTFLILPIAILGWICGALVNYLADVLPLRRRIVPPFCVKCEKPFPLKNYLLWPRRCPDCGTRRSFRTWLVEFCAVAIAVWLWLAPPGMLGFWGGLALLAYFGVIVVIDVEHHLILHPVSLFGAGFALIIGVWLHGLVPTLLGGLAGFGIMLIFYYIGVLFAHFMARRRGDAAEGEALGFGDVALSGVLGLLLGWPTILVGLFLGILFGAVASVIFLLSMLLFRRFRLFAAIPYGPFLIAGAVVLLYFRGVVLMALAK